MWLIVGETSTMLNGNRWKPEYKFNFVQVLTCLVFIKFVLIPIRIKDLPLF